MNDRSETYVCEVCGNTVHPVALPFRNRFMTGCPFCSERKREEEERNRLQADIDANLAAIEAVLLSCGVGSRHVGARLDDFTHSSRTMHLGDQGLYVYGSRGTGKTHLMAAVMRALIIDHLETARAEGRRPWPADYPRFISSTDLLREIRATFGKYGSENENSIVERYGTCPALVLDDLGAEQATEWAATTLYSIIDQRYRDMRRTFITSNLSLTELAAQTGDRITSRLAEMCRVVRMSGPDRRLKKSNL